MSAPAGAVRVQEAFERAGVENRAALVAYLMAGYPDAGTSIEAAAAALDAGADVLEIGVPFSDPVADGPVIADAGHAALAAGGGLDGTLEVVRRLRARGLRQPILAMGYLNPLLAHGARRSLGQLAEAGVDAIIVPDLPAAEDVAFERLAAQAGLGIAFLVTPNTPPDRLERAIRSSSAFLYVVPLYGVTGARDGVSSSAVPLLERIRATAGGRVPVAVGFGVSRPEHVRRLGQAADGIIVGSALVTALTDTGAAGVAALVRSLVAATGPVRRSPQSGTVRRQLRSAPEAPPAGPAARRASSRSGPAPPSAGRPVPRR